MRPTRTAARANDCTRLGVFRQEVVFGGSQTLRGKSRSNFLDAPRIGELELYAKSGIARLALPALRVNQRIVTFDAAVVSGDTSRACYSLSHGRRWEPIFLSSRSEERRIWSIFERRVTTKWGKLAPPLRVAAQIGPDFIVILDCGPATAFGLRLVWPDFRPQRRPRES